MGTRPEPKVRPKGKGDSRPEPPTNHSPIRRQVNLQLAGVKGKGSQRKPHHFPTPANVSHPKVQLPAAGIKVSLVWLRSSRFRARRRWVAGWALVSRRVVAAAVGR
jgi:hypothetical protein